MTVGQLKAILALVDDDTPIILNKNGKFVSNNISITNKPMYVHKEESCALDKNNKPKLCTLLQVITSESSDYDYDFPEIKFNAIVIE